MFRVLSEEEALKVTRWHAPDLPVSAGTRPVKSGSLKSNPARAEARQAEPGISSSEVSAQSTTRPPHSSSSTVGLDLTNPSIDTVQASYDDGYSRGFAEGNAALHQDSVKELNSIVAALNASATSFSDHMLEMELVALSMDIARLVIRRELATDPLLIQDIVKAGLNQLPELNATTRSIHLHPLDANVVREVMDEHTGIHVVDDASLEKGACRIESGASVVNAGIDDWLAVVGAQLGLPANDTVPEFGNSA